MQYYPFDSRNPIYRSKIGAVASGENLKLRLLLHNDAYCTAAYLILINDFTSTTQEIPLTPAEGLENYQFWDCELTLDTGLYWYFFRYESRYGEFFVTKCAHSTGFVSRDGKPWQQTVYDNDFNTPNWLDGGIITKYSPTVFIIRAWRKRIYPPTDISVKIGPNNPNTVKTTVFVPFQTIITVVTFWVLPKNCPI